MQNVVTPAYNVHNRHLAICRCFTNVKGHKNRGMFLHKRPPWVPVATHTASLHMPVFFSMHFSPMLHIIRLLICSISKARNMAQTRPFPCAVKINTEPRKTRPTLSMKKGWTPKDGQHSVATTCQVEQNDRPRTISRSSVLQIFTTANGTFIEKYLQTR